MLDTPSTSSTTIHDDPSVAHMEAESAETARAGGNRDRDQAPLPTFAKKPKNLANDSPAPLALDDPQPSFCLVNLPSIRRSPTRTQLEGDLRFARRKSGRCWSRPTQGRAPTIGRGL
ncbi:Oidioi.mRNA.OKI2018_I69.PAR.g9800.t1.cds [Oikopleura dioica]|uniref:Oidioi.mRNA.OKI2018_I69.PAR.g9800.t1.cds n=1 Tax=Oikopleura dioica TaxID=34765 RepID=A0ABN7RRG8_OIKDI|nr:Oidioi.mRNA.OKI2018_I69.PAR.g9800.t1.cds [Oikopleura dioica]